MNNRSNNIHMDPSEYYALTEHRNAAKVHQLTASTVSNEDVEA